MKFALAVLLVVCAAVCGQFASLNEMDIGADNCIYVEGKQYGCFITTNLYCDSELYFQLVSARVDSSGFVLASGIFEVGNGYYQCFGEAGDNMYLCLNFGAGTIGTNFMSVGYVVLEIHDNDALRYYRYDQEVFFGSDVTCGDALYVSPPCSIYTELEEGLITDYPHSIPNNYQGLNAFLASPETTTPYNLVVGDNNCVFAAPNGFVESDALPLYCPDIWYNACSDWQKFTSRAGLYFEAAFGTGYYCGNLPSGMVCVSTDNYVASHQDSAVHEVRVNFWVYLMTSDYVVLDQIEMSLVQSFPACAYSLEYACQIDFYSNSVVVQPVHHDHDDDDHHQQQQHHSDSHHSNSHSESKHKHSKDDSSANVAAIIVPVVVGSVFLSFFVVAVVSVGVYYYRRRANSQSKVYSLMVQ